MAELFEGSELGPIRLKNRFLKAATFEGRARRGVVSDELIEFHRVMAAGGIAMTTVAYLAVSSDGRTDRHCILLSEDSLPGLARLTKAVHDEGALVSAQIGHAGPVANARSNNAPSLAPSSGFSAMGARLHEVTTAQLDRIVNDYAASSPSSSRGGGTRHRRDCQAQSGRRRTRWVWRERSR